MDAQRFDSLIKSVRNGYFNRRCMLNEYRECRTEGDHNFATGGEECDKCFEAFKLKADTKGLCEITNLQYKFVAWRNVNYVDFAKDEMGLTDEQADKLKKEFIRKTLNWQHHMERCNKKSREESEAREAFLNSL